MFPFSPRALRATSFVLSTSLLVACGESSSRRSSTAAPVTSSAIPAQVLSLTPPDGSTDLALDQALELVFSEAMDPQSLAQDVTVRVNGVAAATSHTLDASAERLTIRPTPRWPGDALLELEVRARTRSAQGASTAPFTASLRTRSALPSTPRDLALPGAARSGAVALFLPDGQVFTCGGENGAAIGDADRYDPETGRFAATAPLAAPRTAHTASLLQDGRVLVAGGYDTALGALDSLEVYTPASDRWSTLPVTLASTRVEHVAFVLPSGRVAFVGGLDTFGHAGGRPLTTVEVYDPRDGSLSVLPGQPLPPGDWAQLPDGRLLNLTANLVFDLDRPGAPTPTQNGLSVPRSYMAIATLADGRLLFAGGASGFGGGGATALHAEVDLFDPQTLSFSPAPPLATARFSARAVRLSDGRVAVVGGGVVQAGPPTGAQSLELFDPSAGSWSSVSTPKLDGCSVVALDRGGLLITGSREEHTSAVTARAVATHYPAGALLPSPGLAFLGAAVHGGVGHARPDGALELRFSAPVDPATLAGVALVDPSGATLPADLRADGARVLLAPRRPLVPRARYALALPAGLASTSGAALSPPAGAFTLQVAPERALGSGGVLVVEKPTGGAPATLFLALDRNQDGDLDDPDELRAVFVTAAGSNLQEPCMSAAGVIYLPDAAADQVLRLVDLDGDGDAQDAGEARVFFDNTSPLGAVLTSPASVALGPDGALWLIDNGSGGGADDLLRLIDLNGDGDALDAGEATIVNDVDYAGAQWGLGVDAYGRVFHTVTGGGGNMLVAHEDLNGDGDTLDVGERVVRYVAAGFVTDVVFDPAQRLGAWVGLTGGASLEWIDAAGVPTRAFSDPTGSVGGAASASAYADGSLWVADTASDTLWRLEDRNGDGDFDDTDELRRVLQNAGGTLTRPYYSAPAQAPAPPRAAATPAAQDVELAGQAAPFATVRLIRASGAQEVQADALGAFRLTLNTPLAAGEALELDTLGLGGRSRSLRWELP
ncbi:MAG: Ig-like domain-containing protein [Planctomycetota bacterium]